MQYEGTIIRPPSEANSIILQVTAGCSHNKCTFCGAYNNKPFRFRSESIDSDLEFASRYCKRQKRIFLADGDVLVLPFRHLVQIFEKINRKLPWVNRISLYANGRAIRSKSDEQLLRLKEMGLNRIYLGLESGDDIVLQAISKGETSASLIEAAQRIRKLELFLSVTVLLGIGGINRSQLHAKETGLALSKMFPQQIAALTVMVLEGTELHKQMQKGSFILPDSQSILKELKTVIQFITLKKVQFYSNHASNYLHLSGRLPKDKQLFLDKIDAALEGSIPLVDEQWRAL